MLKDRIMEQLVAGERKTTTEIAKALNVGFDACGRRLSHIGIDSVGRRLRELYADGKVSRTPVGGGKVVWQRTGHAHGHGCGCVPSPACEDPRYPVGGDVE